MHLRHCSREVMVSAHHSNGFTSGIGELRVNSEAHSSYFDAQFAPSTCPDHSTSGVRARHALRTSVNVRELSSQDGLG
ncbi:hypothetical protein ABH922_004090 [Rhodococcus sp. 27YEA15]